MVAAAICRIPHHCTSDDYVRLSAVSHNRPSVAHETVERLDSPRQRRKARHGRQRCRVNPQSILVEVANCKTRHTGNALHEEDPRRDKIEYRTNLWTLATLREESALHHYRVYIVIASWRISSISQSFLLIAFAHLAWQRVHKGALLPQTLRNHERVSSSRRPAARTIPFDLEP